MTGATAHRTNSGTLCLSVRAIDRTNLGTDWRGEIEEPTEGIGDCLAGLVKAGLRLTLVISVFDPSLQGWKLDAFHYKVVDAIPGEMPMDLWDARRVRRAI